MDEKDLTYKDAMEEIDNILESLESETPDIDNVANKVSRASELLELCRKKLLKAEEDIEKILAQK
ncbi:MAG: exodeoxyribonuclease VII small subunit [Alistipes sp.]|nr:exodeoxyribonuclease VII small subunit [Candidatus Alistipes equi]